MMNNFICTKCDNIFNSENLKITSTSPFGYDADHLIECPKCGAHKSKISRSDSLIRKKDNKTFDF